MTIEFWPKRLLQAEARKAAQATKLPRLRRPKLPIRVGKAHQMLSAAVLLGDHEMASWVDLAVKRQQVTGTPEQLLELSKRLDAVMEPLPTRLSDPSLNPALNPCFGDPTSMTTTLLEEPVVRPSTSPSQRLRTTMAAVRVSLSWLGVRKTLTAEQKSQAADTFGAEGAFLSAGKKLLDTTHPAFKAVTAVKGRIIALWKSMSLPYPEPGIRLIRQDQIETLQRPDRVAQGRTRRSRPATRPALRRTEGGGPRPAGIAVQPRRLPGEPAGAVPGRLGLSLRWSRRTIWPQLNPDIYQQECERVAARFDEAVQLAEQAFIEELQDLVSHLTERLTGQADNRAEGIQGLGRRAT